MSRMRDASTYPPHGLGGRARQSTIYQTMPSRKPRQHTFFDKKLETLQRVTFDYFLKETNPQNGLVPDSTRQGSPCSITPAGFALAGSTTTYTVVFQAGPMTARLHPGL
jgi:hypothetical protein